MRRTTSDVEKCSGWRDLIASCVQSTVFLIQCPLYTTDLMWVQEVMQQLLEPTDEEEAGAHDHLGEGQEPAGQQE